jgi:hypothetical protein
VRARISACALVLATCQVALLASAPVVVCSMMPETMAGMKGMETCDHGPAVICPMHKNGMNRSSGFFSRTGQTCLDWRQAGMAISAVSGAAALVERVQVLAVPIVETSSLVEFSRQPLDLSRPPEPPPPLG